MRGDLHAKQEYHYSGFQKMPFTASPPQFPPSPASRQLPPSSNSNHIGKGKSNILSFCSIAASKSDGGGRLKISIRHKAANTAAFRKKGWLGLSQFGGEWGTGRSVFKMTSLYKYWHLFACGVVSRGLSLLKSTKGDLQPALGDRSVWHKQVTSKGWSHEVPLHSPPSMPWSWPRCYYSISG